jgi:hypothetical protein
MRHCAVALVFAVAGVWPAAQAADLNHRLKGSYALSYTRTCAQTPGGFANPQLQAIGNVIPSVVIADSVNTYDGHGNFTSTSHLLSLNTAATASGSFPVSESTAECSGTYQVAADGTFTEEATSCNGSILSGSLAGQTYTSTGSGLSGRIHGAKLLVAEATPRPQTITYSGAGTFQRVCGRSGSGFKIEDTDKDE